jgi:hypothetical protein
MCKIRSIRKVTYRELFFSTTIHCRTTAHTARLCRAVHEVGVRVDRPNSNRRAHCHMVRLRIDVELRPGASGNTANKTTVTHAAQVSRVTTFPLFISVGYLITNLVSYGTSRIPGWGWRLLLWLATVHVAIKLAGTTLIPELLAVVAEFTRLHAAAFTFHGVQIQSD